MKLFHNNQTNEQIKIQTAAVIAYVINYNYWFVSRNHHNLNHLKMNLFLFTQ